MSGALYGLAGSSSLKGSFLATGGVSVWLWRSQAQPGTVSAAQSAIASCLYCLVILSSPSARRSSAGNLTAQVIAIGRRSVKRGNSVPKVVAGFSVRKSFEFLLRCTAQGFATHL